MKKDITHLRENYERHTLLRSDLCEDPLDFFVQWLDDALGMEEIEPNAFSLGTLDPQGFPKSRIVLLKQVVQDGFIFYTNYTSSKGTEIALNNRVSMNFLWKKIQRQVCIIGNAYKIDADQSKAYFHSRPRGSQIGAWVSNQSELLEDRSVLEEKLGMYEEKFKDLETIPYPEHWGGYLIKPIRVEFWQGRPSRLHDRFVFTRQDHRWDIDRLSP